MKKAVLLIIPFLFISCTSLSISAEKKNELIKDANHIANSLKTLVNSNPQKKSKVTDIINAMYKKMNDKELFINIDFDRPENIYEGAGFAVSEDNKGLPHVSINPYLISLYKQQPSIVYSILIHEFTHAYSYFTNKQEFVRAHKNDLELYLYEMDASYIEALFIKEFLSPRKFQLTKYERLLLKSLDDDNLSSFSICLRITDRELTYALFRIVYDKENINKKIESIEQIGNKLVQSAAFNEKKDEWNLYCLHISLKTYIKYVPEVLLRIAHNDLVKRKQTGYFNMSNYPGIEKIRNDMIQITEPYNNTTYKYYKKLYNSFMEF